MIADPTPEGPTETRKGWSAVNARTDAPIAILIMEGPADVAAVALPPTLDGGF
jgi:hypothetical protein